MSNHEGSLIVIDGVDGSGKATQTELLVDRLKDEDTPVETIEFPQYKNNILGELIGECLDGQHGEFDELDPKVVSVLYAADRFESKDKIEGWLSEGKVVVADRYVSSNQMHQGGKIDDPDKKKDFLRWLDTLEYEVFGVPRPDEIFYLDVPAPTTKQLLEEGSEESNGNRYTKRRLDVVEDSDEYTQHSLTAAKKYIKERRKWHRIDCTQNGELLSKQAIHKKLYERVSELI